MIGMLYLPEIDGLPYLAVTLQDGQVLDATPFERRSDAEAYLAVCEVGRAADLLRASGTLQG